MKTNIERAKEIALGIETGKIWVDADLSAEIAGLLHSLATFTEPRREALVGVEFALSYYSEPKLYYTPPVASDVILDGGLRARAALSLLKAGYRNANQQTFSTGDEI